MCRTHTYIYFGLQLGLHGIDGLVRDIYKYNHEQILLVTLPWNEGILNI